VGRYATSAIVDELDATTGSRFWKTMFQQYCVQFLQNPVAQTIECVQSIRKSQALRRLRQRRHQRRINNYLNRDNVIAAAIAGADSDGDSSETDGSNEDRIPPLGQHRHDADGQNDHGGDEDSTDSKITCIQVISWPIIAFNGLDPEQLEDFVDEDRPTAAAAAQLAPNASHRPKGHSLLANRKHDKSIILAGTIDDCVDCYDARTGELIFSLDSAPHSDYGIRSLQVAFVPRSIFSTTSSTSSLSSSTKSKKKRGSSGSSGSVGSSQSSSLPSSNQKQTDIDEYSLLRIFGTNDERIYRKPLIIAVSGKVIKVWDLETGRLVQTFAGHTRAVNCLAFAQYQHSGNVEASTLAASAATATMPSSPSSDQYFVISGARVICVWNLITGENTHTLKPSNTVGQTDVTSLQARPLPKPTVSDQN